MKSQSKAKRHPTTGCIGLDKMLDGLTPDGHAACLVCAMIPIIDAEIGKRMVTNLRSRVRTSKDAISGPVRDAMVQAADLSIAERAASRRRAVKSALRKAHTD